MYQQLLAMLRGYMRFVYTQSEHVQFPFWASRQLKWDLDGESASEAWFSRCGFRTFRFQIDPLSIAFSWSSASSSGKCYLLLSSFWSLGAWKGVKIKWRGTTNIWCIDQGLRRHTHQTHRNLRIVGEKQPHGISLCILYKDQSFLPSPGRPCIPSFSACVIWSLGTGRTEIQKIPDWGVVFNASIALSNENASFSCKQAWVQ